MTQIDLSAKLGVAPRYIGNIEQGYRKPSLDMLVEICNCFNIGISDILPIKAEPTEKDKLISEIMDVLNAWEPPQLEMLKSMVNSMHR